MGKEILQTKENEKLYSEEIFVEDEDIISMDNKCIAACPTCITRSCTLIQGHYGSHQCSEGHTWQQ